MARPTRVLTTMSAAVACLTLGLVPATAQGVYEEDEDSPTENPGAASVSNNEIKQALDLKGLDEVWVNAHPEAIATSSTPFGIFPTTGSEYLILSTGLADEVIGGDPEDFLSTDLYGGPMGADGNDLAAVTLLLDPPEAAQCLAFDFQFLSEEYPDYIGSSFNDIFTAELINAEPFESKFSMEGNQVIAPHNFAYDDEDNYISINTVLGFSDTSSGTGMNGATEPLVAVTPIEQGADQVAVILSVQDIGDPEYDSAVLIDNLRWFFDDNCHRTVDTLTDSDGDALPDHWETDGVDFTGNGTIDLDLPALGADPERADIFLHLDWMVRPGECSFIVFGCVGDISFHPHPLVLQQLETMFRGAPVTNPDGSLGITLHIDAGRYSPPSTVWAQGGYAGEVTHIRELETWSEFDSLRSQRLPSNHKGVFHYGLLADQSVLGGSGNARGIPTTDFFVTEGHFVNHGGAEAAGQLGWNGRWNSRALSGTIAHELGHNLGLHHPAENHRDNPCASTHHYSVMAYACQMNGMSLSYSYDEWQNLILDGGGAIGDAGAPSPVLEFDDGHQHHEMTPADVQEFNLMAEDGSGTLWVIGPQSIGAAETDQGVVIELSNVGDADADYTVTVATPSGEIVGSEDFHISAGKMATEIMLFDASDIPLGETELDFRLWSEPLEEVVDGYMFTVIGLDLDDPQVQAGLLEDLVAAEEIDNLLSDEFFEVVSAMVEKEGPENEGTTPWPTPSGPETETPSPSAVPSESPITPNPSVEPSEQQPTDHEPSPSEHESPSPITTDSASTPAEAETPSPSPSETKAVEPQLSLSAEEVQPGAQIELMGSDFFAGEDIEITLDATLATVEAKGDGTFRAPVRIPDDIAPGNYVLTATGLTGESSATAAIAILAAEETPTPTPAEAESPSDSPEPSPRETPAMDPTVRNTSESLASEAVVTRSGTPSSAPSDVPATQEQAVSSSPEPAETRASTETDESADIEDDDTALPSTGSTIAPIALMAVALVSSGLVVLLYQRRHRKAER